MTRSLWQYLGRGFLVLALCGAAVGCGDDDDDDAKPGDGGVAGKGGTGGKGGSGGKGGGGGTGGTFTKAQCVTAATAASKEFPSTPTCIDCGCTEAATAVGNCNAACWELIACSASKCADKLADEKTANECVTAMCSSLFAKPGALQAAMVGPTLTGKCGAKCGPGVPDAGPGDDGGVDAGQ